MDKKDHLPEIIKLLHDNPVVWQIMHKLEGLQGEVLVDEILENTGAIFQQFELAVKVMSLFHIHVQTETRNQKTFVLPLKTKVTLMTTLTLTQWAQLQFQNEFNPTWAKGVKTLNLDKQISDMVRDNPTYDLSLLAEQSTVLELVKEDGHQYYISVVEEAVEKELSLEIEFEDGRKMNFYPHRLVFVEEGLKVVGENTHNKQLDIVDTDTFKQVRIDLTSDYTNNYGQVEIDDFLTAIRNVNDSEIRLVLKITDVGPVDLMPKYHFLGDPYIIENREGDKIWAASVEISDDLYSWLDKIFNSIEILEPVSIIDGLREYQSMKMNGKKAA